MNLVAVLAALFAVLASPYAFKLTNGLLGRYSVPTSDASGKPTNLGLGVHAAVFFLVGTFLARRM